MSRLTGWGPDDEWHGDGAYAETGVQSAQDAYFQLQDDQLAMDTREDDKTAELLLGLASLTEKQAFVIALRFGLKDGYCYTEEQVADLMGVKRQSVWETEHRALDNLRAVLGSRDNSH